MKKFLIIFALIFPFVVNALQIDPQKILFSFLSPSETAKNSPVLHKTLTKSSAITQKRLLVKKQTYTNFNFNGNPNWVLSEVDTFIYNQFGKVIVQKTSDIENDWSDKHIIRVDSLFYMDTILQRQVTFNFTKGIDGKLMIDGGNRSEFSYQNNFKSFSVIFSYWNTMTNSWVLGRKYDLLSKTPIFELPEYLMFYNLTSVNYFQYDSHDLKWILVDSFNLNDSFGNDTTLVFDYKSKYPSDQDTLRRRYLMTFSSPSKGQNSLSQQIVQELDSLTHNYINTGKTVFFRSNDYLKESTFFKNDTTNLMELSHVHEYFLDRYGNDTLTIDKYLESDVNQWTSYSEKHFIDYDQNGDILSKISLHKGNSDDTWTYDTKELYTYKQLNVGTIAKRHALEPNTIKIKRSQNSISFTGKNISQVKIFSLDGRLLSSRIQSYMSQLSINVPNYLHSGVYIAEVTSCNVTYRYQVSFRKF